jgi:hypothetical protein
MLSLSLAAAVGAADYYLSADGDDARDGLSPERSWRSLTRVPVANLKPGDRVLLRGGDAFHGSLSLTVSGAQDRPITIASYGTGRATVFPPVGVDGIRVTDAGWIVVRDLDLRGPGADAGAGYLVCQYDGARPLHDNVIRNCSSIGDGRAKNNGAVFVIGAMERTLVENCTLSVDPSPTHAACWRVFSNSRALQLRNNVCIALENAPLFPDARTGDTTFGGNRWWPPKEFELPAGDVAFDAAALETIPAAIDEAWLASLPSASGQPATVDASWDAVLKAAGCEGRQPRIGASALKRYGPAPY